MTLRSKQFTSEAPHVVFTPEMRALSDRDRRPGDRIRISRRRSFTIGLPRHIKYSYAIEYSTIRNISEYCRSSGYGDCGQEALLFITLCRLNGIPARWQSGWNTFPGAKTHPRLDRNLPRSLWLDARGPLHGHFRHALRHRPQAANRSANFATSISAASTNIA